jgi:transcriptional regulator with XRE-family HTH domain
VPSSAQDLKVVLAALGRAVKEIRKEKEVTQEELSRRTELHESYISIIESGQRNPKWSAVRRISYGLEVPLAELARRAEEFERGERSES